MEKKNTILLTVIAVATLLVAVVGATFAYFTASTQGTGNGNVNTGTATSIGTVRFNMNDTTQNIAKVEYPGGMMATGAKVTATVTGEGTFKASYAVTATVDASQLASENTTVEYALYRTTTPVEGDLVTGCELKTTKVGTDTQYSYDKCAANTNLTEAVRIDNGTVAAGQSKTDIKVLDDANFSYRTLFNTREEAENEANIFYLTYFVTKEYMNQFPGFFYFNRFQCLDSFLDVARKADEYGADSQEFSRYVEKQVKMFQKHIESEMRDIKGQNIAYSKYGTFDYDELMNIAKEETEKYRKLLLAANDYYKRQLEVVKFLIKIVSISQTNR